MALPYLTSATLIDAVRRRCSLPKEDSLLSDNDILELANDEMLESVLPMVKGTHEEYFVWEVEMDLEANKSKYPIPERSLGNALRDIAFEDAQTNLYEMTRIHRDDRYTTQFPSTYNEPYRYFVENSHVVMVPEISSDSAGKLIMAILLRPNQLVASNRVAKIQQINDGFVAINSVTTGSTTTITTISEHFLSSNEEVTISSVTGLNNSKVNGTHTVTVTDDFTFTIAVDTTGDGPFAGGLVDNNTTQFLVNSLPTNITSDSGIDILKTKSPHNFLNFDVPVSSLSYANNTLTIKDTYKPSDVVVGDTIASVYETDIPGIPTELHRHLVTKTCERVMELIGDQRGLMAASKKSAESEVAMGKLIENRVSSAPLKVRNTHGFLNRKYRRTRRF